MVEEKKLLKKENVVYERDDTGKLIPKLVKLINKVNGEDVFVKITPLTRGERKRIAQEGIDDKGNTTKDIDIEIVLEHCKDPVFSKEELEDTRIGFVENIALTVFRESNMNVEDDSFKKASEDSDKDFQKA